MTILEKLFKRSFLPTFRMYLYKTKWPNSKKQLQRDRNLLSKLTSVYNNLPKLKKLKERPIQLSNCTLYCFTLEKDSSQKIANEDYYIPTDTFTYKHAKTNLQGSDIGSQSTTITHSTINTVDTSTSIDTFETQFSGTYFNDNTQNQTISHPNLSVDDLCNTKVENANTYIATTTDATETSLLQSNASQYDNLHMENTSIDNHLTEGYLTNRTHLNLSCNSMEPHDKTPDSTSKSSMYSNQTYEDNSTQTKHEHPRKRVVFFLHGGAFLISSPSTYKLVLYCLAKYTNSIIYSPDYRLCPEACYPKQIEDCLEAYKYLIETEKVNPKLITFIGDSAGGNLSVTICMKLIQQKYLPLPAAVICFSPWLDLSMQGPSYEFNRYSDLLFPHESIRRASWLYVRSTFKYDTYDESVQQRLKEFCMEKGMPYVYGNQEENHKKQLKNPMISPIYFQPTTSLNEFPPMLIHTASTEMLLSDTLIFARKLNYFLKNNNLSNLPSFDSLGSITKEDKQKLKKYKHAFQQDCDPEVDPTIRATVVLWKNEFHAFPMFGPLDYPYSKYCLKLCAKWILNKIPLKEE